MRHPDRWVMLSILAILLVTNLQSMFADEVMTYRYNAPESELDKRYEYHWEILKTALEKTTRKYGPYRMVPSTLMTERRQEHELQTASGKLTIMYLDTTPEREKELLAIHIPVDKSLVGYRVMLIRKDRQHDFDSVTSLDQLRQFSCGQGLGWVDVDILRRSEFKVITGSSYDGLFEMLLNRRFDMFSRGVVEVVGELEQRQKEMPELCIEDHILLYYPAPMYFWFTKNDEGKRLAARAEEGMRMMIEDGTYDQIFTRYNGPIIDKMKLKERKLFRIDNPFLVPETPFSDKRLWFDPSTK